MFDTGSVTSFFIYAFTSIFVIVNPVSGVFTFLSLTEGMGIREKREIVRRSVLIACVLAIVMAVTGELILLAFGITADSLRVAGGLLLFAIAFDMMHARTSRESVTPEEIKDASKRSDISIFPLTTPLLTGPGAITTVIIVIRTGKTLDHKIITIAAIMLTFVITYFIFRYADSLYKMLGVTVMLVINRIMGLFLAAIAVNFVAVGSWNLYQSFM